MERTRRLATAEAEKRKSKLLRMNKEMETFFTAEGKGLTSTSANHVANLAKEMIRENESVLSGLKFYSTELKPVGMESADLLKRGCTPDDLAGIYGRLTEIAEAKSLIAWLREAISARSWLLSSMKVFSLEDYAELKEIELPEKPVKGVSLTEEEYWAGRTTDERCRYYSLEAAAATFGGAVHPEGSLAGARKELMDVEKAPTRVEIGSGDALVYYFRPTVENWEVEEVYFKAQKRYREVQSRLNEMKYGCEKAMNESESEVRARYATEMSAYTNEMTRLEAELESYRVKRAKEIAGWRIVIPESLSGIYTKVTSLGKA